MAKKFNINHALNCKKEGFVYHPTQHNLTFRSKPRLRKVYTNVETEPCLKPVNGEQVVGLTGDEARPDVRARLVWLNGQNAYFDIRVTNASSNSQRNQPIDKVLKKHEAEKKRQYLYPIDFCFKRWCRY